MAVKGQKYVSYSESMKLEAIRLHLKEKWTYKQITEHFEIQDNDRANRWVRKLEEIRIQPSVSITTIEFFSLIKKLFK